MGFIFLCDAFMCFIYERVLHKCTMGNFCNSIFELIKFYIILLYYYNCVFFFFKHALNNLGGLKVLQRLMPLRKKVNMGSQ